MSTPVTKKDLFLAILSMDSYQRGYGIQITLADSRRSEIRLGNAVIKDIANPSGYIAAGFYAIAYDVSAVGGFGDANTVIAYRGTDYDETDGYKSYRDMFNGWSVGAGYTGDDSESVFGWTPRVTVTLAITPLLFGDVR
jgi:hypothetical protein